MTVDLGTVEHHLAEFARSRRGVEGYVEPSTNVSATTIVLIAVDGEWTRRAVGTPRDGFALARRLGIPVYDVNQTGYPARMREWSARKQAEAKRAERAERLERQQRLRRQQGRG